MRASGVSPRAPIPDVADGAISALEAEGQLAREASGRDKRVVIGALRAKGEDLQDLFGGEVGLGSA
eukprot:974256-Rhodomonas_salina.1